RRRRPPRQRAARPPWPLRPGTWETPAATAGARGAAAAASTPALARRGAPAPPAVRPAAPARRRAPRRCSRTDGPSRSPPSTARFQSRGKSLPGVVQSRPDGLGLGADHAADLLAAQPLEFGEDERLSLLGRKLVQDLISDLVCLQQLDAIERADRRIGDLVAGALE